MLLFVPSSRNAVAESPDLACIDVGTGPTLDTEAEDFGSELVAEGELEGIGGDFAFGFSGVSVYGVSVCFGCLEPTTPPTTAPIMMIKMTMAAETKTRFLLHNGLFRSDRTLEGIRVGPSLEDMVAGFRMETLSTGS